MLHDDFLEEVAKAVNSESFVVPSHEAYSTTDLTLDPAMASFNGEVDDRNSVSGSRVSNATTFTGIRSGTSVGSSSGETLYEEALFSASSGGTLLAMVGLPGILHTTAYDIESSWEITFSRA